MSDDEKTEATEQDAEKSQQDEKKARRSSILKPQKPRNPLSSLDFLEPNPDTTIAKAARRVSFASSNLVKPFAADPEKNTIWDTTYEEEVNHTDSTKSSYEQTQDTKSHDILNATSIYFHEPEEQIEDFKSLPPRIWEEKFTKIIDKENVIPELHAMAIAGTPQFNQKVDLITVNKENIHMEKIVRQEPPLTVNLWDNASTNVNDSMNITNITNKENVNPIIYTNDATFITPAEMILRQNPIVKAKGIVGNVNSAHMTEHQIHVETLEEVRCKNVNNCGEQTTISQYDMELTDCLSVMDIRENNIDFDPLDVKSKAIYPNKCEADLNFTAAKSAETDMEFTCALSDTIIGTIKHDDKVESEKFGTSTTALQGQDYKKKSSSRRETIHFDGSSGEMEFTTTLPVNILQNNLQNNKTVNFDDGRNDMELTTIKSGIINENCSHRKQRNIDFDQSDDDRGVASRTTTSNIKNISKSGTEIFETSTSTLPRENYKGKTIYFDPINRDMEFTTTFPVNAPQNNIQNTKTINFNDDKSDMELTTVKSGLIKENYAHRSQRNIDFNQSEDHMEPLSVTTTGNMKNISRHGIEMVGTSASTLPKQDQKRKTIYFDTTNGDMEFTTTLPINVLQNNVQSNKTMNFDEDKNDMELTTIKSGLIRENLAYRKQGNIDFSLSEDGTEPTSVTAAGNMKNISRHGTEIVGTLASTLPKQNHKRKTIYFDTTNGDMEFTTTLPINVPQNSVQSNKTINLNEDKSDMELTTVKSGLIKENYAHRKQRTIDINQSEDHIEPLSVTTTGNMKNISRLGIEMIGTSTSTLPKIDQKRKTIYFETTNGDMEFTTTLPINVPQNSVQSNKTINLNEDKSDMELTTVKSGLIKENYAHRKQRNIDFNPLEDNTEPTSVTANGTIKNINRDGSEMFATSASTIPKQDDKRKIIYDDMDMDTTLPVNVALAEMDTDTTKTKHASNTTQNRTINFTKGENHMELTTVKSEIVKENGTGQGTIDSNKPNDDMELTSALSDKNNIIRVISKLPTTNKTTLEGSMDITERLEEKCNEDMEKTRSEDPKSMLPLKENVLPNTDNLGQDFSTSTSKSVAKENVPKIDSTAPNANVSGNKHTRNNLNEVQIEGNLPVEQSAVPVLNNGAAIGPVKQNLQSLMTMDTKVLDFNKSLNVSLTKIIEPPSETNLDLIANSQVDSMTAKDSIIGIKRQSNNNDGDLTLNKRNRMDPHEVQTELSSTNTIEHQINEGEVQNDIHAIDSSVKEPKLGLQTSTLSNSNILYSEPMRIKLKTHKFAAIPDLCDNLNIQSLNSSVKSKLGPISTPATSFHMTLTDMSPGIEDTQQLINATFSKPELSKTVERIADCSLWAIKNTNGENVVPAAVEDSREERSYLGDIDVSLANSPRGDHEGVPIPLNSSDAEKSIVSPVDNSSQNCEHNYTLRAELVLKDITKYTEHYEIDRNVQTNLAAAAKECKKNLNLLRDLIDKIRMSRIHLVDLEEKHKQDNSSNENSSNMSESATNSEDDRGAPSMAGITAPKSLYERVCEAAERNKKHWKLHKVEDDYYYFFTLFGSLPFKVHIHPDLGIVYDIQTHTNLGEDARPVCWYDLKVFQQKLKEDNLSSVLGTKYDILTLLDYVYMTMDEVTKFHLEYIALVKKYGVSHHFRMNRDLSVTFEIINLDLIIHWIISVNIMPNVSISKETVKAVSDVGQKVHEEDIICIAENTPKGLKFLSNFIENVDEYVKRTEKKIKFRRGKH